MPGGVDGTLLDYLKKTGGNMTGSLTANYGFEAGIGNNCILKIFQRDETCGVTITGNLEIGSNSLFIGGKQLISYISQTDTATVSSEKIDFEQSVLKSAGEMLFGENAETGVFISPQTLLVRRKEVFHRGNACLETINRTMKDANIAGKLRVEGDSILSGLLYACYGVELGSNGQVYLSLSANTIHANRFLSFASGYGIKIDNMPVLVRVNEHDIQLGAVGGDLHIGNASTTKIRLQSNISDTGGDYVLLSKHGAAYFPDSLTVRHNFGEILLSSYRKDSSDEGITVHKRLRFGTQLDRFSASLALTTEADFVLIRKPLEAQGHIGIDGSLNRLTGGGLFFTEGQYLLSATDGIKYGGNAYFPENLSSERFSSGFAGSGRAIIHNATTGNAAATFDELTVRKKMRIYEPEVQKISATNGSLRVSDTCSGDTVIKIES